MSFSDEGKLKNEEILSSRRRRRWPWLVCGCLFLCGLACCLLIIASVAVVGAGGAIIGSLFEENEVTLPEAKTFTVESDKPVELTVNNGTGQVIIQQGSADDEVTIEYTKKAYGSSKENARRTLDKIEVQITQDGNTINVETDVASSSLFAIGSKVDLTITVPAGTSADITNEVGNIEIRLPENVFAEFDAQVDVGEIDSVGFDDIKIERWQFVGAEWQGTLGSGDGEPPLYTLRVNTGSITIEAQ